MLFEESDDPSLEEALLSESEDEVSEEELEADFSCFFAATFLDSRTTGPGGPLFASHCSVLAGVLLHLTCVLSLDLRLPGGVLRLNFLGSIFPHLSHSLGEFRYPQIGGCPALPADARLRGT